MNEKTPEFDRTTQIDFKKLYYTWAPVSNP